MGTYATDGDPTHGYQGTATANGSSKITFDPTQLYLTQSITGIITNLTYSITDPFFGGLLPLNTITQFAFDGSGTLKLYSDATAGTGIVGTWTSDMTTAGGQAVHMTDVFGADGTHVEKVDAAGGNIEMHFDYTIVDASSITLKYVSGTINGRPTPGQMVGMPQTVNYKLTGDTLSVSQPGKMTIQFTRS